MTKVELLWWAKQASFGEHLKNTLIGALSGSSLGAMATLPFNPYGEPKSLGNIGLGAGVGAGLGGLTGAISSMMSSKNPKNEANSLLSPLNDLRYDFFEHFMDAPHGRYDPTFGGRQDMQRVAAEALARVPSDEVELHNFHIDHPLHKRLSLINTMPLPPAEKIRLLDFAKHYYPGDAMSDVVGQHLNDMEDGKNLKTPLHLFN